MKGDLEGQWTEAFDNEVRKRIVDHSTGDVLASCSTFLDASTLTKVVRAEPPSALVIPHCHSSAALAADHQPLEQGWTFPWRPAFTAESATLPIFGQPALVLLKLLPVDVSGMGVFYNNGPLFAREGNPVPLSLRVFPGTSFSKTERSRVARIVQGIQRRAMAELFPDHLAAARLSAPGEQESFPAKGLDAGPRRAGAPEGREKMPQGVLHLLVGIQHDALQPIIDQADGKRHFELSALCFTQDAPAQPSLENVQFGLTHCPSEPKEKPVVEVARIVEPVFIEDEGAA
jgi:hypothetical protein